MATRKSKTFTVPGRANKPAVPASAAESIGTVLSTFSGPSTAQLDAGRRRSSCPRSSQQRLATQKVGAQIGARRRCRTTR